MNYLNPVSWLAGLAAATTLTGMLPAYAETNPLALEVTSAATVEVPSSLENAELSSPLAEEVTAQLADQITAETSTSARLLVAPATPVAFQISDQHLLTFDNAGIQTALVDSNADQRSTLGEGINLAQSSGAYGGVSPAYLGAGGNFGFGDPKSAIGDFGVVVISKISLGPRFSIRPNFFISERYTNITVPLTYNFNTLSFGGFRMQPYVGAGADIPFNGNVALLVNAGADVPISRDFTLNTAANFRVTSGFGLGLTFGVGYNFPFIFE